MHRFAAAKDECAGPAPRTDGAEAPSSGVELEVGGGARWPRPLVVAYGLTLGAVVLGAMGLDLAADRRQQVGLDFLRPAFSFLAARAATLRWLDVPPASILPAAIFLAVASVALSRTARRPEATTTARRGERRRLLLEVSALLGLSLVVVAYRFYALNRIPRNFVGELVFQVVCTSDWRSLLAANGGSAIDAPWAPLGLLHYLLMAGLWRFSGSTVLTLCFASAVSSVVFLQVLYWFVRLVGGPRAAFIAAALYAASPLETVWGRHAMFPFSYPSILVFLIAAATYLAIERRRLACWLLTAFLMALTRHSFGSAYAAFLIPVFALAWLGVFDRARLRSCGWKPLLLMLGVGAWLAGPALAMSAGAGEWRWVSPLDPRLSERAFGGTGWRGSFDAALENVGKVVEPLYEGKRGDTLQTPLGLFDKESLTFLSPLAVILFTAALPLILRARGLPSVAVLVSLVAGALLPGLLSTADPHRQAAFYPALCAVAGLAAVGGLRAVEALSPRMGRTAKVLLLSLALPILLARSGAMYFSQPMGEPAAVTAARRIKQQVEPRTLLVIHVPFELHADLAYLLFDDSLVEPFGWMFVGADEWEQITARFQPRFDHLFHRYTALRHRVAELERTRWERFVFVFHNSLGPGPKIEDLKRNFGAVKIEEFPPLTADGTPAHPLTVVSIEMLRNPGAPAGS